MEWSIQRTSGELRTGTDSGHCSLFKHPSPSQAWRGFWQLFSGLSTGLVLLFGDKKRGSGTGRQMKPSGTLVRHVGRRLQAMVAVFGVVTLVQLETPNEMRGQASAPCLVAAGWIKLFPTLARCAVNQRVGAVYQTGSG